MPYAIVFLLLGLFLGSVVTFLLVTMAQQERKEEEAHRAYLASLETGTDKVASHHQVWR